MPADEAIKLHLSELNEINGWLSGSSYRLALRDARVATGRNADTGKKINEKLLGNWLGAIGYLLLLDQIGSCFKPLEGESKGRNTIIRALENFAPSVDKQSAYALYALRCSFAHDFNLSNIGRGKGKDKELLTHHFTVGVGLDTPLVLLPSSPWNGIYSDRNQNNKTKVNLEKLGDLVEEICEKIQFLADSGRLRLNFEPDELIHRYNTYKSEKR